MQIPVGNLSRNKRTQKQMKKLERVKSVCSGLEKDEKLNELQGNTVEKEGVYKAPPAIVK